jgi:MbtH protein
MENEIQYFVVSNHQAQYSIWPAYQKLPLGWQTVGVAQSQQQCLQTIEKVWTDITPLSFRKRQES